jgi:predicted dehydrogenase
MRVARRFSSPQPGGVRAPRGPAIARRRMLGLAAGCGAGALAAPWVLPGAALGLDGAAAPSDRIALAAIGLGFGWDMGLGRKGVRFAAVCDVHAQKRNAAKQHVDRRSGTRDCTAYRDFREVLARPDLDAVYIATPDHWHALVAIAAARAGKDMYCQKPVTHTVEEGRAVVEAVNRHGIVFQHGTQQRSEWSFQRAVDLVRNGRIGRLKTVRLGVPAGRRCPPQPVEPVPPWLDWDMWLGPAPWAPFATLRCLPVHTWYFISDYCVGYIAGWGVHHLDSAVHGLGDDLGAVVEVDGHGVFPKDGLYDTPVTWRVQYGLDTGATIVDADVSQERMGVLFEGTEGKVFCWRDNRLETEPKSLRNSVIAPHELRTYSSTDHFQDWLDAVRTRGRTATTVEIAHRSTTLCNIGAIAMLLDRKLRWDVRAQCFLGDDEANRLLARPMREPWSLA